MTWHAHAGDGLYAQPPARSNHARRRDCIVADRASRIAHRASRIAHRASRACDSGMRAEFANAAYAASFHSS
ncbi:hypothetical protein WT60_20465 [Burkholderia sp. MSMB617WGS]|nr:hypothetical protein WT60_20465 [Burkholderia sp. MSMB617WGS]